MIYSKCCSCGGDVEVRMDVENKLMLSCLQCSRVIGKSEALLLLKKIESKKTKVA